MTDLIDVITAAHSELVKELKDKEATFLTPEQEQAWRDGEDDDDDFNEAPQVSAVGRHGDYLTYAVTGVKAGTVRGIGKDDSNWGETSYFELSELPIDDMLQVATAISYED